jgi:hypothetical protein
MKSKTKHEKSESKRGDAAPASPTAVVTLKHLKWGWWSLLVFLTVGIFLETLHGFKVGAYLDVPNATRRMMWTLAHAHGTLLSLMHIAFAVTIPHLKAGSLKSIKAISNSLIGASILMPGGFFLGGAFIYGGDPGLGILLLPIGAFMLFIGVFFTAKQLPSKSQ